jgi:hypothetical protein
MDALNFKRGLFYAYLFRAPRATSYKPSKRETGEGVTYDLSIPTRRPDFEPTAHFFNKSS